MSIPAFNLSRCSGFICGRITTAKKVALFGKACSQKLHHCPGVRHVALSDWRPGRDAAIATFVFEDRPNDPTRLPSGEGSWVSADFFQTVGTPLIAGRTFTEHDDENAPPVVIINSEAAHQFWPNQDPIGKRIGINYTGPGRRSDAAPRLREIVGVVGRYSTRFARCAGRAGGLFTIFAGRDESRHGDDESLSPGGGKRDGFGR